LAVLQRSAAFPDKENVQICNTSNGQALRTLAADHKNISTLAFAPDGKTLATAGWHGIRYWDVATGRERSRSDGEGSNTEKIAFSGDAQNLVTLQRYSGAFHLWDVTSGKRKPQPAGHTSWPYGTTFSSDGTRLASSGDNSVHVWDLATGKSLFNIYRDRSVRRVEYSRDGRFLYSAWSGQDLWISDAATGERQHVITLEDPERPETYQAASSLELTADGKKLIAFSSYYARKNGGPHYRDTLITGWDTETRKQLFRRRLPSMESQTCMSVDARLLAMSHPSSEFEKALGQGPMRIEDLATGELLLRLPVLEGQSWPLAFSPDGRFLASVHANFGRRKKDDPKSTGSNLILWELATAAEVLSLPLAGQYRVAFSADGRLLVLTDALQEILVWDLAQHRELRRFKGFDSEVTSLAFAPNRRQIVSGLADSTFLIWDVGTPAMPETGKLGAKEMAKSWDDLAGNDAPQAFRARWTLASASDATLALFRTRLKPAQPADSGRLQKLVEDLDSQQFAVRNAANKELEGLGDLAADALRQVVEKTSSLELRRRAQSLLEKLRGPITSSEALRALRAVAVLEDMATLDAQQHLKLLSRGAPGARLTEEAQAALQRHGLRGRESPKK
jgi:WD40 repeat protein